MIRRTLTILSLIGLLLSVGAWGVSYWRPRFDNKVVVLGLEYGCLGFAWRVLPKSEHPQISFRGYSGLRTTWAPLYRRGPEGIGGIIPLWIPTVLLGVYPFYLVSFWRISLRLLPELEYCESKKQRKAAMNQAARAIVLGWRFWLSFIAFVLLTDVAFWGYDILLAMFDPAASTGIVALWVVYSLFTTTLLVLFFRFGFRLYRRSLRIQLGKVGIPICLKCGYDLRASKDICPECGTEFSG